MTQEENNKCHMRSGLGRARIGTKNHFERDFVTSTFAWLDFSDRDRKRAMDVVDLFREDETRDELGIGVIRDAISDRLFPGTSTIQTRIRYFLFIPWLFRGMNARD